MLMFNVMEELADSHCHLDCECDSKGAEDLQERLENWHCRAEFFHLMSTNHIDLHLIDRLAHRSKNKSILPYFGIHPWYSHLFTGSVKKELETDDEFKRKHYLEILEPPPSEELLSILPSPISLSEHLELIGDMCQRHGRCGIGEIGLDKLFRVPSNGYFGNREVANDGVHKLSACRVRMSHQKMVFESQLSLANAHRKQVSLHCVKAQGALIEVVSGFSSIPSIILHSYSGSVDQINLWKKHCKKNKQGMFISLSNWINGSEKKSGTFNQLVGILEDDQILIETDFGIDKFFATPAKQKEYIQNLEDILQKIRLAKEWDEERVKKQIASNIYTSTTAPTT